MATNPIKKSVLNKTSLATDVQYSAGGISIAGLVSVSKNRITSIRQIKSKPEVVQVATVSTTATPTASTPYKVFVYDPLRTQTAYQESQKPYSYTTSATLVQEGGTAALQREFINAAIIAKINADSGNNHATAVSLGGGTGFTITDVGGYYPVFAQSMTNVRGVNTVFASPNSDGTGFPTTVVSITTPAIYSFGIGANLAAEKPIVDFVFGGNVISGNISDPPLTNTNPPQAATTGQNYDCFVLESLTPVDAIGVTGQYALAERIQRVFYDNGTGSSVTNLAGAVAFEREMLRGLFSTFENDSSVIFDFFDNALIASSTYPTTGLAISTTDNVVMAAKSSQQKFDWYINPIGAHTILTPIVSVGGISPFMDVTTQEGLELSPPNLAQNPKEFVVGKTEASFYVRLNIGSGIAATDFKSLSIGFRKKAAYAVDQTAYEAASVATAAIGVPLDTGVAPVFNMITGPGSAGSITNTSTVVTPTVSTSHDLFITVDINGVARFYVNGVDKTPLLAATYTFTAGLHLMPFISFRHGANAGAAPLVLQGAFVPSIQWRA